jgi:hypothetical protein
MEWHFSTEAKDFCFSAKEGSPVIRLEERRRKFVGFIFASIQCSSWLVDMVEEACLEKEDITKSYREGGKVLMVHGGANKAGRFLEVFVYAEGGRKGVLWLPDGRFRRGWHRFAGELRLMVVPPEVMNGLEETGSLSLPTSARVDDSAGCSKERSFRSLLCMDILQVSSKDAVGTDGDDLQLVVDCFDLEYSGVAAGPAKMGPSSVKRRVEKLLGFFQLELG